MDLFHNFLYYSTEMYSTTSSLNTTGADCSLYKGRHSSRFVFLFRNLWANINKICNGDKSLKEKLMLAKSSHFVSAHY